jgi:DNA (cytosine-5)-methyltransferase 1
MRYGSVCSGIEGASVAWRGLGWRAAWFAEIDPFASAVLEHHYPATPNLGDMTGIGDEHGPIDLLVGGTPCQSFSVAGLRGGLADERGNLALEYLRLAGRLCPRWIVWENVPGVLTADGGRAFGAFLGGLAELRYGWAYRVLDASGFGTPQQRRRVFVVGCAGNWRLARAALFDGPCVPAGRGEAGEVSPGDPFRLGELPGGRDGGDAPRRPPFGHIYGCTGDETPKFVRDGTPTLRANQGGEGVFVASRFGVRRLSAEEWEALQGFPRGYTAIRFRGRPASDSLRCRALGNSFPVPVVRWIGRRIQLVEERCLT